MADQIAVLNAVANGEPYKTEDVRQCMKTLEFMAKYEGEIRAGVPTWKEVREDPTIKALVTEIPISSIRVTDASK